MCHKVNISMAHLCIKSKKMTLLRHYTSMFLPGAQSLSLRHKNDTPNWGVVFVLAQREGFERAHGE